MAVECFRTRTVDESWSAFRFLRKLGNGLNRDGRLYYRIGYGIRLGNVSSSPFRAIELREHRASSAPALRNRAGASAGKPSLPAFTSPPASNTRRFSASPVVRRLRESGSRSPAKGYNYVTERRQIRASRTNYVIITKARRRTGYSEIPRMHLVLVPFSG